MKYEYETIVKQVCGDDWSANYRTADDKDGALGIAMILAFLRGTNSKLHDLSREIDVPPYILETAYKRLQVNGLLSGRSWIFQDRALYSDDPGIDPMTRLKAWCHVAGLASGYTGLGQTREEYATAKDRYGQ